MWPIRTLVALAFMSAPLSAIAHHSPASFDQTAFVVIEGTVAEFKWGNPHVYLAVEMTSPTGEHFVQQVEAGPASQLLPRGLTRDLLRPGDPVTVRANPNRRGARFVALGVELTTADGSRFPLHARALTALGGSEGVATSIEGTSTRRLLALGRRDTRLADYRAGARTSSRRSVPTYGPRKRPARLLVHPR